MMRRSIVITFCILALSPAAWAAVNDQPLPPLVIAQTTTAPQSGETPAPLPVPVPAPPATGTEPQGEDLTQPDPNQTDGAADDGSSPDELSLGEIPVIETMELTADIARRALDSYVVVKTKYENSDLESFENLQDFVDQNPEGKNFEADIKTAGFANVNDWNKAITTLGFAYTGVTDDQSADINQQISEIEADTELAQDMKDRMIASLKAMIPSDNNKKVVEELMKDPAYAEKLKQLDIVEE